MNWQDWIKQTLPRTENLRGGATVWLKGGTGLLGDKLGPIMHFHDDASEIFYFLSGRCRMEVGLKEYFFGTGEFVLVPPQVPHNLWNVGDSNLLLFWIVAPHFPDNMWRTTNFQPDVLQDNILFCKLKPGIDLPSNSHIYSRLVSLTEGESIENNTFPGQEAVLYILDGQVEVWIGKLKGVLKVNDFIHVPGNTKYVARSLGLTVSMIVFQIPGILSSEK